MTKADKSHEELLAENEQLRLRLEEAEDTLRAIGSGEVDAFVVSGPDGEQQVFTLKGAEQPYRILVESMSEGAATLAIDGTILYCNKRLADLLKVSPENLVGTSLASFVATADQAMLSACAVEHMTSEMTMVTGTGKTVPVLLSCCPNDYSGNAGISVVITDLTQQKRNEALLASENFSTSIVELASEAIIVCDAKGKVIRASQSAHDLCGTNPLLKPFGKMFRLQFSESGKLFSLSSTMGNGRLKSMEVEFKRNDGRIVHLLLNATTIGSLQNMDIGSIVTLTDITERKLMENALQQNELRLRTAYSHLQIVNEELQVANKELQAQGEELQKQREELQHKNRELARLWELAKKNEAVLRESENLLKLFIEYAPAGLAMFDRDMTYLYVSQRWCKDYGVMSRDLLGRSHYDVLPEISDQWKEEHRRGLAGEVLGAEADRFERADGSIQWIHWEIRPWFDSVGLVGGIVIFSEDITARIQAEEAVRESEARYRLLFESSLQTIFTLDDAGRLLMANPASERISGYSSEELTNRNFADLCTPDQLPSAQTAFLDILNGAPREIETAMIGKDGRRVELLVSGAPMIEDGSVRGIFCVAIDITARKHAEEALRRYELLARHSRDIMLFMEFDSGQILEVNAAAVTAYGYTREELLERTIHDLRSYETHDVTATQMAESTNRGIQFETVHRRKDGSSFPVEVSSQGAMIGRTLTLISVVRDITDRKQREAYRSMGQEILLVLNENNNLKEAVKRVINTIKSATGIDAVGIRLQDEDDFPYFYQEGFPEDFLLKENSLLARTRDGGICRDEDGNFCLECTCGLVVTSKTDPSSPLFTKGGSSWTNDSFPFLHVPVDNDMRTNPRNECIHQGFASVALIPIRAKGRVVGLLQLNDRRKGSFTLEGIETLEKIAENIGESMLRKQAEEALRESEQRFRLALHNSPVVVAIQNRNFVYQWAYNQKTRHPDEIIGRTDTELFAPEDIAQINEAKQRVLETGQEVHVEQWVTSNGQRVFLSISYEPLRSPDGEITGIGIAAVNLTKQKLAEEALKQSEKRHRLLAETMLQGVIHQDADGRIISMNPAAEQIMGKNREEMLGQTSVKMEPECIRENGEIFPGMEHPAMVALRTGQSVRGTIMGVFNPKHNEYRWIGIAAVPLFNSGETVPSEVYTVFGDITERKQAQETLRQQEERLRMALEAAKMAAWDWHVPSGNVIWNDMHYRMMGYTPGEVQPSYQAWASRVHPEDVESVQKRIQECMAEGTVYTAEFRTRWPDGTVRWLEARGETAYNTENEPQRQYGVMVDITERKQDEEALKHLNIELEERVAQRTEELAATVDNLRVEINERKHAEENVQRLNRLYTVISETNQAIIRTKDKETIFNDFCRIAVNDGKFILAWAGLLDEESGALKIVAAHGATGYLDNIRITANEEPAGIGPTGRAVREGTYSICNDFLGSSLTSPWHERGRTYGIRASASIAMKQEGQVIGALTLYADTKDFFDQQQIELLRQMGTDISFALDIIVRETCHKDAERALYDETVERMRATEALREKEQMLIQQSRQAAMGEMIGNIAHQWRQPLNVLGLNIQQQKLYYDLGEFTREFLENSVDKSMEVIQHMSRTIDDFRNFFKPDKESAKFKVSGAIASTLTLIGESFKHDAVGIAVITKNDAIINGYKNEYAQVVLNILVNARDALLERGIKDRRVSITLSIEEDKSVVTIADNAGGIPEEIIAKIFDPYFTTKGPQTGTGVGLFMSKTIIEKNMNGRLTARNIEGGAEFRIEV